MNLQSITTTLVTAIAVSPARFDLAKTGLSDAQLKAIAGARPCEKTCTVTSAPITRCCWG